MSLLRKGVQALKWSVLGELGSRVIGPLAFLVLAWKLTPDEFGVAAAATILISFSQVVWDSGLSRSLVQRQDRVPQAASIVFWLNLGSALVLGAVLFACADLIAGFFGEPRVAPALRVLVWQLPLSAVASVQAALLQRELAFRQLFWSRLLSAVVAPLVSVVLVYQGASFWALVAGALAGQMVQTAVVWRASAWRPQRAFDLPLAREVWHFGRWAMLAGFLGWLFGWVDSLILGHFLGPEALGLFRTGNSLVAMVFGVIFGPLVPVIYSLFSRVPDDLPRLREGLLFVVKAAALIALPLAAWVFAASDTLATTMFRSSWHSIADVLAWMALVNGASWLVGYNGEVYRAIGRPALESIVAAALSIVYVVGLSLAAQVGLLAFLQARLAIALLAVVMHVAVAAQVIGLPAHRWVAAAGLPALCAAGVGLVVFAAQHWWGAGLGPLVAATLLAAGLYVAAVAFTQRPHVQRWRSLLAEGRA